MSPIDPSVSAGQNTGILFYGCRGRDEYAQGGDGWDGGPAQTGIGGGGGGLSQLQPRQTTNNQTRKDARTAKKEPKPVLSPRQNTTPRRPPQDAAVFSSGDYVRPHARCFLLSALASAHGRIKTGERVQYRNEREAGQAGRQAGLFGRKTRCDQTIFSRSPSFACNLRA